MTERVNFKIEPHSDADTKSQTMKIQMPKSGKKEIDKTAEELGFQNKSAAYRYFITLGMNAIVETDPRNQSVELDLEEYRPMTIRDVLPKEKESAVDIRTELLDKIDERLFEELQNDPAVKTEGWSAWIEN